MQKDADKIYVRCPDRMCFWVDARTLEPAGCSFYDAYAFTDPLPVPTLELTEWLAKQYP